jgi:uncharacterized protein YjiS (DUF1127 family)
MAAVWFIPDLEEETMTTYTPTTALTPQQAPSGQSYWGSEFNRVVAAAAAAMRRAAERRRQAQTVRRLRALGHRDLKDIGIGRSEILSVVYAANDGERRRDHAVR